MKELQKIASSNRNVHVLQIDLKDFDKYPAIVSQVKDVVGDGGLNVLFNSAGVSPRSSFLGLKALKANELMDVYAVNCVAPLMLTKAFIPLLQKASDINKSSPLGVQRACVINMSTVFYYQIDATSVTFCNLFKVPFSAPSRATTKALSIITVSLSLD